MKSISLKLPNISVAYVTAVTLVIFDLAVCCDAVLLLSSFGSSWGWLILGSPLPKLYILSVWFACAAFINFIIVDPFTLLNISLLRFEIN